MYHGLSDDDRGFRGSTTDFGPEVSRRNPPARDFRAALKSDDSANLRAAWRRGHGFEA